MIVDKELEFSDNQNITAAVASTKSVDLEQVSPTPGMSKQLAVTFTVAESVTGTISFALQESDNGSTGWTDIATTGVLTAPEAGFVQSIPVPYQTKRYLRAYYGGSPTRGKVNAVLSNSTYAWKAVKQADSVTKGLTNSL